MASTRSAGSKASANVPAAIKPPPPTPGAGDKTMRAQIDRLRSGRDVFKEKYEAAQARLAESERRASDLEGRLAAKSEVDVSLTATTSDFSELVERLEEVTASCENALAKQRERFKVKLAASKSHSDQISTDLKAAHSQAAVCAREVAELRLENKSLEERMGELRIALATRWRKLSWRPTLRM